MNYIIWSLISGFLLLITPIFADDALVSGGLDSSLLSIILKNQAQNKEIHTFSGLSKDGSVIEELSTTSSSEDSFYIDSKIERNVNRKSFISLK